MLLLVGRFQVTSKFKIIKFLRHFFVQLFYYKIIGTPWTHLYFGFVNIYNLGWRIFQDHIWKFVFWEISSIVMKLMQTTYRAWMLMNWRNWIKIRNLSRSWQRFFHFLWLFFFVAFFVDMCYWLVTYMLSIKCSVWMGDIGRSIIA